MTDYYILTAEEALKELNSNKDGLTDIEAKRRLEKYGYNELHKKKEHTAIKIFLSQFKNPLSLLLVFAATLSLVLGENIEAVAMFFIIIINAILGFMQEYRAEKAMEALEKVSSPTATVIRNKKEMKILSREVVPGDILVLESGDIVAADARLISLSSFEVDEASLTGESMPSGKRIEEIKKKTPVSDQENMVFMGTIVTYGKAFAVVTATDMKTELGKIAHSIQQTKETKTPLQVKFENLAEQIGMIAVGLIFIVFMSGLIQGTLSFWEMLIFALVLTVSTVPNSLPIIVTVSLSVGSKFLAKKNMLIKKLPAAESLGAATIICSDKTGTITKNQMTVTKIFYNDDIIDVDGVGYNPVGKFSIKNHLIDPEQMELLLRIGLLCNNSDLVKNGNEYNVFGDPTEGSLVVLAKKGGFNREQLIKNFSFVEELPFDSERKIMSVIYKNIKTGKKEAYVKGAPDLLIRKCSRMLEDGKVIKLTKEVKDKLIKANDDFALSSLRVLGFAYKEVSKTSKYTIKEIENDLIFVGLTGMMDPPREGVKEAIEKCNDAGIKVMIITGDHALTTQAVAQQIGLFKPGDMILTGEEIEKMSEEELESKIENIRIIARALPIQKLRVVDALKKKGHIVAMTGDGVNDAPALKKADIGISMGITGTDVAKEVSKAILVDDHFVTIVNAIAEGRNIYDKMIKSAKYLLSCNSGEIFTVFMAIMIGLPLPLLPLQLLMMNLLTDVFPAIGLGMESSDNNIMKRPPRNPKERPITRKLFVLIVLFGLIMGIGTLIMFINYQGQGLVKAQTIAFTALVLVEMFAVLSSRTFDRSLKHLNPFSNMWLFTSVLLSIIVQVIVIYWAPLQNIFGTTSLILEDWTNIIGISFMGFVLMEISKFFINVPKKKSVVLP